MSNTDLATPVEQLRVQYNTKLSAAKTLANQWKGRETEMPRDVAAQIDGLLGETDQIKVSIQLRERLEGQEKFMSEGLGPRSLTMREAGPFEGDTPVDVKAWREVKVDTPAGQQAIRYHVPIAVEGKGYDQAYEKYLRKGFNGLTPVEQKTLSEGIDTAGGFLVPPDYQAELIKKTATMAMIRAYARKVQTSRDVAEWPRVNYTTDDKYTSGVRLTWTGELPGSDTAARVTDPVFGLLTIPVHTAMASLPISMNQVEDSAVDIQGYASDLMAEAFALGEDNIFINGTGANQPLGMLAEVNTNGPSYVVSGASAALSSSGDSWSGTRLINLFYAVPAQYRQRAVWVMNSGTMKEVENLVDAQKRPIVNTMVGAGLPTGIPDSIKSRVVVYDEFMPDLGADTYPILFGDLSGYIIVDRVGFSIQVLREKYAEQNVVVLLARKRVGGYTAEPYRMKVLKAGTA